MVFSSYYFLFCFLPFTLGVYYLSPARLRRPVLTAASYLFYGWANPLFIVLLALSTLVDFFCGRAIAATDRPAVRRAALMVSLVVNLSILGFFKYADFLVENLVVLDQMLGWGALAGVEPWNIILPLGLSFYTLQSMSYTIDVYCRRTAPASSLVDFACYLAMFPQLVAGPIVRFSHMADQLPRPRLTADHLARGVLAFSLGLAKKVLLANPCGRIAQAAFASTCLGPAEAWLGLLAYAMQIYFDFSGYSDMAVGLGRLLGYELPFNFDSPYRAAGLQQFWRRWHITLYQWLRDYLYIPLGGNRAGPLRNQVNLMLVLLLAGLWHGAAWGFLLWAACHGLGLVTQRLARRTALPRLLPRPVAVLATFAFVTLTWTFFRTDNLSHAWDYLAALFSPLPRCAHEQLTGALLGQPYLLASLSAALLITWCCPTVRWFSDRLTPTRVALAMVLLALSAVALAGQHHNPFIYFTF